MGALNFPQFLGVQKSCLATAKVLLLEIDQRIVVVELLLQAARSRGCQTKFCSDTASSADHECRHLQGRANDPTSQGSTHHLLLPYPPHPTTHQHALPPLYPRSVGSKAGLIHGVITCTQLRLIWDNCHEGDVQLVKPKQADSTYHPSSNSHRITESLRLENTSKIIKSNHQRNITMPTKPCPEVPHPHVFWTPPGMMTPPPPWTVCSNTWLLFQ